MEKFEIVKIFTFEIACLDAKYLRNDALNRVRNVSSYMRFETA